MVRLLAMLCLASTATPIAAQRASPPGPFTLGITETFHSVMLGEDRMLNIHLPPGYAADTVANYPVIYLLDGGADEDFIHVCGALQFASFEWIQWMPPSIVVGIVNTDRRRDLTHPTRIVEDQERFPSSGGSAAFQRCLSEELIPFVEAHYRARGPRTLIGQSFAALFAAEVLLRAPQLFQHYLIVSPSLWWDNGSLLELPLDSLLAPGNAPATLYVAVGREGRTMVKGAQRLAARAKKSRRTRVGYSRMPNHAHANILHQAVLDGFRWRSGQRIR
ncbi:MAG: alpha/beta hydrolase [Flavobacteriales bacterium]|nr:alpha/beta hydrolase [Flavobacteriales bacterium]